HPDELREAVPAHRTRLGVAVQPGARLLIPWITAAAGQRWAMDVSGKASRQAVPGIDEHMDFQHREWRWQRVGRVALGLLVFGACLGLVGGAGPLNRTAAGAADGSLLVEYDRFVRVGAVTTVRLAVA